MSSMPSTRGSIFDDIVDSATRGEAFQRFDDRYRGPIVAAARRCGLQQASAEDVAQDVLCRLWVALRTFDYDPKKGTFRGWLTVVVRHAVTDLLRRQELLAPGGTSFQEKVAQLPDSAEGRAAVEQEDVVTEVTSSIDDVPSTAEWEAICRAKARAEADTWQCFELRVARGWEIKDVAQATGKGKGAVHTAIYRVRKMIRDEHEQVLRERRSGSGDTP